MSAFLTFISLIFIANEKKYVKVPFWSTDGAYSISTVTSENIHLLKVDTELEYNIFSEVYIGNGKQYKRISHSVSKEKLRCVEWKGKLILEDSQTSERTHNKDILLEDLHFYTYSVKDNSYLKNFDNGLSFSNKIKSKTHSVIEYLFENNIIDKRQFTFFPPSNKSTNSRGYLYFGKPPKENFKGKKKIKLEVVSSSNPFWNVRLDEVFFLSKSSFSNKSPTVYFSTSKKNIMVPGKFLDFYKRNIISKFIDRGLCSQKGDSIYCSSSALSNIEDIYFKFDKKTIILKSHEVFLKVEPEGEANDMFVLIFQKSPNDEWIFGTEFLKNFIVTFNYDDNSVSLYYVRQSTPQPQNNKLALFICKTSFIIIIIIGICFVFLYNYILFRTRNARKRCLSIRLSF